ncbi:MAG TPA: NAD(P)H-dependent oxidoreductase [Lentimicrobium sp.]|jgi:glutathione-regulated potassium-efflux system ancillary protein KefG|nr:NAD(P)H-dependent oxidoreductase [Lentimicrobium sp.]
MRKILILFAHPRFEHSVVNMALADAAKNVQGVTFHDLYQLYPDYYIDVEAEHNLLIEHDVIVWHHPFYWYSCPPLLKQWIDIVLEYNWAYGHNGNFLKGKYILNAITTGGAVEAYQKEGRNRFTVRELLAPFEQTAFLCKMEYLPPFAIQGTHLIEKNQIEKYALAYADLLNFLSEGSNDLKALKESTFLNSYSIK